MNKILPNTEIPGVGGDGTVIPAPITKRLNELVRHEFDDPNELIMIRYLCRGAGMLLVGPTGIGKSSFSMQAMILWALALPHFDILPARPLKSLLVQAENDEGDLAEMRDGVFCGLELNGDQYDYACKNIITVQEDARSGMLFCSEVLAPLLQEHKPDLVWIDPALAYLGGEANNQKDVGTFLRNYLNPLLHKFNCAAIIVHHTNKPPSAAEKPKWHAGEFAYMGSGSAEWANWARAVLVLRSTESNSVFQLVAGKRGARLGWADLEGNKAFSKLLAHEKRSGAICWREADLTETPVELTSSVKLSAEDEARIVLGEIPDRGSLAKEVVIYRLTTFKGIGRNKARGIIRDLISKGGIYEWKIPRRGNRPEIHLARGPQQQPERPEQFSR